MTHWVGRQPSTVGNTLTMEYLIHLHKYKKKYIYKKDPTREHQKKVIDCVLAPEKQKVIDCNL